MVVCDEVGTFLSFIPFRMIACGINVIGIFRCMRRLALIVIIIHIIRIAW
jgi:hypothetical protein